MELIHVLIPAGIFFLSGSAFLAFYWAVKNGQFRDLSKGAQVIFDEDEPVGKATDCFPGRQPPVPLVRVTRK